MSKYLFEMLADALNQTLKFPADLAISHCTCGVENAFYSSEQGAIMLCYELLEQIATLAAESATDNDEFVTRVGEPGSSSSSTSSATV